MLKSTPPIGAANVVLTPTAHAAVRSRRRSTASWKTHADALRIRRQRTHRTAADCAHLPQICEERKAAQLPGDTAANVNERALLAHRQAWSAPRPCRQSHQSRRTSMHSAFGVPAHSADTRPRTLAKSVRKDRTWCISIPDRMLLISGKPEPAAHSRMSANYVR